MRFYNIGDLLEFTGITLANGPKKPGKALFVSPSFLEQEGHDVSIILYLENAPTAECFPVRNSEIRRSENKLSEKEKKQALDLILKEVLPALQSNFPGTRALDRSYFDQ